MQCTLCHQDCDIYCARIRFDSLIRDFAKYSVLAPVPTSVMGHRSRMQPLRGRDLLDGIRWGSIYGVLQWVFFPNLWIFFLFHSGRVGMNVGMNVGSISHSSQLAIGRDPMLMVFAAGATSSLNCSLCEAGTDWTCSGWVSGGRSIFFFFFFEKPI